ncbi:ATP-binding protein [Saccharothrix sp. Mg75]|uniref:ATP-binding protein n=1 Tax=Saccharothrix sp. Mg75 TaxID=3445357 RepID=UPI003EEF61C3
MDDQPAVRDPGVRNAVDGGSGGPVVQAGSIGHVSLAAWRPDHPRVPRQLPPVVRGFTGRVEHLAALDALLDRDGGGDRGAVVISALDGTAGVGKTALAVRWAHDVQHRFPDGTLYVDLRGYAPGAPADPGEVLGWFLGALGVPPERVPSGPEERAGCYRSVLAGRRVLVVLDNAHSAGQVRPLLPGDPDCLVVVTSRARLTGLVVGEGATRVTLDLLTPGEALELVRTVLGPSWADAEPDAVVELIGACARLPLALRIAAGRVAAHPHLTLADLVAELRGDQGRWEALSVPHDERTAVRPVFDWSYRLLGAEEARVFRLLGLHPGPEIDLHAAAALAGVGLASARRSLAALGEAHVVEPIARDRYRLHDLLRAYAADRAAREESAGARDRARRNLVEWYAHHAVTAAAAVAPMLTEWFGVPEPDANAAPEVTFADPAETWAWARREVVNLLPVTREAARHGLDRSTVALARVAAAVLGLWTSRDEAVEVCRTGLAAARRLGDRAAECRLTQHLALQLWLDGEVREADEVMRAALALARGTGEPGLVAEVLHHLGWLCVDRGLFTEAVQHLLAVLPLAPGAQDGRLEYLAECHLGAAYSGLGEHDRAGRHVERSLALLRRTDHVGHESYVLTRSARVRQGAGDHGAAIALCELALDREHHSCRPQDHAATLDALGVSLRHVGDAARAAAVWREALAIFTAFGDGRAANLRERLAALGTA